MRGENNVSPESTWYIEWTLENYPTATFGWFETNYIVFRNVEFFNLKI
jgi:hypothetical protein